ncbi:MAG: 3-phosphoshikimate 1-carboxyvinyltransferase, partial [Cytophagales bacterium]
MIFRIKHSTQKADTKIQLASSKSESNRALIINALTGNRSNIENVSTARDSVTMHRLLHSNDDVLDVIDAGTTMRFLTAYLCLQKAEKILTGTPRMCQRPIGILVDALREIGAEIEYLEQEGYPPLKVNGMKVQRRNRISIRGDVSSQYISALLMIAPSLPMGLSLDLEGEIGSVPYINMTLQMMAAFGISYVFTGSTITIQPQIYTPTSFFVESDWSGASYWYGIAALAKASQIELIGLKQNSLQGDAEIAAFLEKLGVSTVFKDNSILINKNTAFLLPKSLALNFTNCPDIAQTMAVICAGLGVELIMTGVESLKIKETDRLAAIEIELAKFGVVVQETSPQTYTVSGKATVNEQVIDTYDDHRMAMAFAPLAL